MLQSIFSICFLGLFCSRRPQPAKWLLLQDTDNVTSQDRVQVSAGCIISKTNFLTTWRCNSGIYVTDSDFIVQGQIISLLGLRFTEKLLTLRRFKQNI